MFKNGERVKNKYNDRVVLVTGMSSNQILFTGVVVKKGSGKIPVVEKHEYWHTTAYKSLGDNWFKRACNLIVMRGGKRV